MEMDGKERKRYKVQGTGKVQVLRYKERKREGIRNYFLMPFILILQT